MENRSDQLKARLLKLGHDHFYKKGLARPSDILPDDRFLEKYIDTLESTQQCERGYFETDVCQGNLLTYLYTISGNKVAERLRKAKALNETCLKLEPSSLTALTNKLVIMIRNKDFRETESIVKIIEELSSCELLCNVARSEIAFSQYFLSPAHYTRAVENYKAVIVSSACNEQHQYCKELNMNIKILIWKYYLSHACSRLLNKGNLESLLAVTPKVRDNTIETVDMLKEVINSDLKQFNGKACILLCDTYKKYETCDLAEAAPLPRDAESVDDLADKAGKLSPNDSAVLEYYGRHLRQRATGRNELLSAINVLTKAVTICPSRHVAYHHMSLCYRQMWLESEGHEENKLFHNSQRTQRYCKTDREQRNLKSTPSNSPPRCRSKPNFPTYLPEKPRSRNKPAYQNRRVPGYFDTLRVSNPKCKQCRPINSDLQNAIKYLELACEKTKRTSVKYLVDLSRLYISARMPNEAEACFLEADILDQSTNDNDLAYFYEQYALYKDPYPMVPKRQVWPNQILHQKRENALELYRSAVIYAIRGRVRSRVAYYTLCQYLEHKKKKNPNDEITNLEYALLYQTMDRREKSIENLAEYIRTSPEDVDKLWRLVRILVEQGGESNERLAFRYLTLLADMKKIPVCGGTELGQLSRCQTVLDVFDKVCLKEKSAVKSVFDWFARKTAVEAGFQHCPDSVADSVVSESYDIALLSTYESVEDGEKSLTSRVIDLFEDKCQLKLAHSLSVLANENILYGLANRVTVTRAVIVIVDKSSCDWSIFSRVLQAFPRSSDHHFPICLLTQDTKDSVSQDVLLSSLPRIPLTSEHNEDNVLLSAIFRRWFGTCTDNSQ